jgi:hypothetical protein
MWNTGWLGELVVHGWAPPQEALGLAPSPTDRPFPASGHEPSSLPARPAIPSHGAQRRRYRGSAPARRAWMARAMAKEAMVRATSTGERANCPS